MQVREIMTKDPACCSPESNLQEIAKLMADNDCGEIPVVDESGRPKGVVTDRDIACRAVAEGRDPRQTAARDVMSTPVITVTPEDGVERSLELMEQNQVRRLPVVDESGACCGMIAQADIARQTSERDTGELVRDVSQPKGESLRPQ